MQTIFVISAPTNGGKTTIMNALIERGVPLAHVVTSNSRPPRADEVDGRDYHFLSRDEFERKIEAGDFIEWAIVHKDYKGVQKSSIFEDIPHDKDILIQLDIQGFQTIKRTLAALNADYRIIGIFLEPPSIEVIRERWEKRGDMAGATDIQKRLDDALVEMEQRFNYDYIVVNDVLEVCIAEVEKIVRDNMTPPQTGELFS